MNLSLPRNSRPDEHRVDPAPAVCSFLLSAKIQPVPNIRPEQKTAPAAQLPTSGVLQHRASIQLPGPTAVGEVVSPWIAHSLSQEVTDAHQTAQDSCLA